jgi:uncharacterized protein (DUF488 family)
VSIGYEGRSAAELVATLAEAGVGLVVDVRLNPVSRRAGLGRRQLPAALAAAGIDYRHEPALGNPPENRAGYHRPGRDGAARATAAGHYRQRLTRPEAAPALTALLDAASAANSGRGAVAVLCVEAETGRCHRHEILCHLRGLQPDLVVDER